MTDTRKRIELADDGSEVVVIRGSVRIEFNTSGGIDVYGNSPVTRHPAAHDSGEAKAKAQPEPGDEMPDGTIFAGISPDTGRPMYITPADAPRALNWHSAMMYAVQLDAYGHKDWHVPTRSELNVIFNNCTALGGFNTSGSWPSGSYWSSSEFNSVSAWIQRFSDGVQDVGYKHHLGLSVRCARG